MTRAVLLEVEGVVVETAAARARALAEALEARRHPLPADAIPPGQALPVQAAVRASLALAGVGADETEVELVSVEAGRRFAAWLGKGVTLAPGAREFVHRLHGRVRLGIVSRATRSEVQAMLSLAGMDDVFEFVVAEEDAWPPKPNPAPYRAALGRLGRRGAVAPGDVVALEDGRVGIAAAKGAGVKCLAVGALAAHVAMDADALAPVLDDDAFALLQGMSHEREERR